MTDIFVSYQSSDRDRAERLAAALGREFPHLSLFWDRTIRAGLKFDEVIDQALTQAACVIVLWSANSVKSDWVRDEAEEGRNRGVLVPVRIDDVKIPLGFRRLHTEDLIDWDSDMNQVGFRRLCGAIEALVADRSREPISSPAEDPMVDDVEMRQRLLAALDERERSLWQLYEAGHSHVEIARRLAITEANSQELVRRTKKKLLQRYRELIGA